MDFDIHQIDNLDPWCDDEGAAIEEYAGGVTERFYDSPEGQARLKADPEMGFWAHGFVRNVFIYCGRSLPNLTVEDVEEVLTDVFPRKVSLLSPEQAHDVIPELIAFWEYLAREYNLPQSESVLKYLQQLRPKFPSIMNDPSNFGMAKSFFVAGKAAGFDMTQEREMHAFMHHYNSLLHLHEERSETGCGSRSRSGHGKSDDRKKPKRKMAKAARRKNRKRR